MSTRPIQLANSPPSLTMGRPLSLLCLLTPLRLLSLSPSSSLLSRCYLSLSRALSLSLSRARALSLSLSLALSPSLSLSVSQLSPLSQNLLRHFLPRFLRLPGPLSVHADRQARHL